MIHSKTLCLQDITIKLVFNTSSCLKRLIFFQNFVSKIPIKVCYNDRNWQCNTKSSTNAANWCHQLARCSGRSDVTIARAGHCNDGPVERLWQRVEHGLGLIFLKCIGKTCANQHAHAHCHCQQQQFSGNIMVSFQKGGNKECISILSCFFVSACFQKLILLMLL